MSYVPDPAGYYLAYFTNDEFDDFLEVAMSRPLNALGSGTPVEHIGMANGDEGYDIHVPAELPVSFRDAVDDFMQGWMRHHKGDPQWKYDSNERKREAIAALFNDIKTRQDPLEYRHWLSWDGMGLDVFLYELKYRQMTRMPDQPCSYRCLDEKGRNVVVSFNKNADTATLTTPLGDHLTQTSSLTYTLRSQTRYPS